MSGAAAMSSLLCCCGPVSTASNCPQCLQSIATEEVFVTIAGMNPQRNLDGRIPAGRQAAADAINGTHLLPSLGIVGDICWWETTINVPGFPNESLRAQVDDVFGNTGWELRIISSYFTSILISQQRFDCVNAAYDAPNFFEEDAGGSGFGGIGTVLFPRIGS